MKTSRRRFVQFGASAVVAGGGLWLATREGPTPPPDDGWRAGEVAHILPTVDHRRFVVKISFHRRPASAPLLRVGAARVPGFQTDSEGLFYRFDITGLQPDTDYLLQLIDDTGAALCDDWPLKTFPAPDADVESFRLLAYTCAGGPDHLYNFGPFHAFLPVPTRQRLFARALAFKPQAVVANGDHVYWDMKSTEHMGNSWRAEQVAGLFDTTRSVLGSANEIVLKKAIGPQIAGLYGVRFRSTPMFFLQDDHDYGENDEADDDLRTFPPDDFMRDLARGTQRLYYPELLCDTHLPDAYRVAGGRLSENFGTLRFGRLFEGLLYDCRRHMTNTLDPAFDHRESYFVPPDVERWLIERTGRSDAAHIAQMPSTPILWSAGKWGEWYPDVAEDNGVLSTDAAKPYWPRGWLDQHNRLLEAAVARGDRLPLFLSGDLHATGSGRIVANAGTSYGDNPVYSILSGAVGTGALGWPSKFRGTVPTPSQLLDTEILEQPVEENGFSVLDFTRRDMTLSHFKWQPSQGEQRIGSLEPFARITLSNSNKHLQ